MYVPSIVFGAIEIKPVTSSKLMLGEDVELAVKAAEKAFPIWSNMSP